MLDNIEIIAGNYLTNVGGWYSPSRESIIRENILRMWDDD